MSATRRKVSRLLCMPGTDVPCSSQQALVRETFVARGSSVGWVLNLSSPVTPTVPVALWSVPLVTNVSFSQAGDKQFWAPWERGNNRDPLLPSDGGYSWWEGVYRMGAEVVNSGAAARSDLVIHEMATVLQPGADVGVSLIPNPGNPLAHPTWLNISGPGACATPNEPRCAGSASFAISRHHLRLGDGAVPHVFDFDLVGHAGCWRGGLGWSAAEHAEYWEPVSPRMKQIEGLGSYSSYLGDLTDPKFKEMGYALNWDLSGRFFPYAGQFLPPVEPGEFWLNDAEGTQPRKNVSFDIIDEYYGRIQSQGFHTLSYFNVFEYGLNVCGNASWNHHTLGSCKGCAAADDGPNCPPPSSTNSWANSSSFMESSFPNALVTAWDSGGHSGYNTLPRGKRAIIPTWQGGVVVDPVDPKLKAHFVAQLERKYDRIGNFEGLVVDRSDWNSLYNFDHDDGVSFIENRTAHLAQVPNRKHLISIIKTGV